ncbi:phage tail protein [Corallococcus sp. AS-1-6]|uniref:phage tail protein n=1 Tax=Corallococcus sp. AS-1-6 TaxID=2874599 RepID=UPI001CBDDDC1|nr:phage tail protein [Corallococcus sp. AS-1-6]MBZ4373247.1 phage tail protein [Corallococcus sp. AS-1-6]
MDRFLFTPDYGAQADSVPRVRKAQFGEGYTQRSADGLNPVLRRWALQFSNLSKVDADGLEAFLRARAGVEAFEFVTPDTAWAVTAQPFGVGDGAQTQWLLQRPLSPEVPGLLVPATGWTAPPTVYVADVAQVEGTDFGLAASGLVTFAAAPAAGAVLTFTGAGELVAHVVCEEWHRVAKGFNAYDFTATFQEEAG